MPLSRATLEKTSQLLETFSLQDLRHARLSLSDAYRESLSFEKEYGLTDFQAASYLATRLPATYAVCENILQKIDPTVFQPQSLLDLGGGPGTASLACSAHFSTLKEVTIIDRNLFFRGFAEHIFIDYPVTLTYHSKDLGSLDSFPRADLVIISYALNELSPVFRQRLISQAWKATQHLLLLVETGTPEGFTILKKFGRKYPGSLYP